MLIFENLPNNVGGTFAIRRAKVPGGWLITHNWSEAGGLTFFPDPEHKWDGSSLP